MQICHALLIACFATLLASGETASASEPVRLIHNGIQINGTLLEGKGAVSPDRTIILVHGSLAHNGMELIATLQELLAERGINVLAINLSLGINDRRGMYDCAIPHRHTHADAVAEIGAWIDYLKRRGARDIVVMGHSQGGHQATRYAAATQDAPIAALVLLAPAINDPEGLAKTYQARTGAALSDLVAQARSAPREALIRVPGFLICGPGQATAATIVDYFGAESGADTPSLLVRVAMPTLVISGAEDTVVPDVPERIQATARSNVQTVTIQGADHFFRDLYAEDVADAVTWFLDSSK